MGGSAWVGLAVIVATAALGIFAWRTKREGESWDHAVDRILNNDDHKMREANRRAGLEEER